MKNKKREMEFIDEQIKLDSVHTRFAQFSNRMCAHQYLRLYRMVTEFVQPGSHVLDWGSGNGHFSLFLAKSGYTTVGYDFGERPSNYDWETLTGFEYKKADPKTPTELPFANEKFDAVVSVGVLEHVRETGGDETSSLKQIKQLLKPNGVFICYHLPNRYSWIEAIMRFLKKSSHQYRFTSYEIQKMANEAGFTVSKIKRYAILPRNIWLYGKKSRLINSSLLAKVYDFMDSSLSRIAFPFCQNFYFVLIKNQQNSTLDETA
jgi:2-polyprenyl-3-methyl-5-hydroxy-6-metoxy-1,4-benzoquinol methylase